MLAAVGTSFTKPVAVAQSQIHEVQQLQELPQIHREACTEATEAHLLHESIHAPHIPSAYPVKILRSIYTCYTYDRIYML